MTPTQILEQSPVRLSQGEREAYFRDGYLAVEGAIGGDWLARLRAVAAEKVELSRTIRQSDEQFDLDPRHRKDAPRLRRLKRAVDQHPDLWEFARNSPMTEIAADLVGHSVKFHSAKLNYKWSEGGDPIRWHQDIQAWPHTNFSLVTLGVYLEDTGPAQGPLAVIPGSHRGELYEMYGADGAWSGAVSAADLARVPLERAVELCGAAGTVVAIHCRVLHASAANHSDRVRPLLLYVYASADALMLSPAPAPTQHTDELVRGEPARYAHMEPLDCRLPPRWDEVGYGSIFTAQQAGEDR